MATTATATGPHGSSSSGGAVTSSSSNSSDSDSGVKRKAPAQWTFPPRRLQPGTFFGGPGSGSSSTSTSTSTVASPSLPAHSAAVATAAAAGRQQEQTPFRIEVRENNPKKRLSLSYARYEKYKAATSKAAYKALGGSGADYKYDLAHGFVKEFFLEGS
jgi:hypothetical protein